MYFGSVKIFHRMNNDFFNIEYKILIRCFVNSDFQLEKSKKST